MSYTALYRQFRPLKFEDMVGQDHISTTLKNQVISNRVGHAYLFCGGRGTGKTTSAKILARAVNCLSPENGEPCNKCEICKEILEGSLTDVVEMDAASNNSVDDVREIRSEVNFLPTKAKYRVYIIDEVHMLSTGAFNALLKTLEEPPEHVKFILATTEPQKLPATILSRCQIFDFKRLKNSDIIKGLEVICNGAKINISNEALNLISVLSEGAMRDAISILERCNQENKKEVTANEIKEMVGLPSLEYINKISRAILENNEIMALQAIDEVLENGKDTYNFLWEVIKYFKDILILKATNKLELYSEEEIIEIKKLADIAEEQRLLDIIYFLSEVENSIKWSSQKTILFQTGIIKICRKQNTGGNSELERKIQEIEYKLNNMRFEPVDKKDQIEESAEMAVTEQSKEEKNVAPIEKKEIIKPVYSKKTDETWKKIIDSLKKSGKIRLYTTLVNTTINEIGDMIWEIEFTNGLTSFNEKILQDVNNRNDLITEIFKETGKEIHIKIKDSKELKKEEENNDKIKQLGIDINIIDN